MKIKHLNQHFKDSELNLPEIGITQLTDGVADVPDNIAEMLLAGDDWEKIDEDFDLEGNKLQKELKSQETELDEFDSLTLEELQEICEKSELRNWKPFKNKSETLKKMLRKKMKEAGGE